MKTKMEYFVDIIFNDIEDIIEHKQDQTPEEAETLRQMKDSIKRNALSAVRQNDKTLFILEMIIGFEDLRRYTKYDKKSIKTIRKQIRSLAKEIFDNKETDYFDIIVGFAVSLGIMTIALALVFGMIHYVTG